MSAGKLLKITPLDRDGQTLEDKAVWTSVPPDGRVNVTLADAPPEWALICYDCQPLLYGLPGHVEFFHNGQGMPTALAQALDWWERHSTGAGHTNIAIARLDALDAAQAAALRQAEAQQRAVSSAGG